MPKIVAIGKGVWRGGMGVFVTSRTFSIRIYIFSSFSSPTAQQEKRGLTLNAPKTCFDGKFVTGGSLFSGGTLSFLPPKPPFLTADNRLNLTWELIGNTRYFL